MKSSTLALAISVVAMGMLAFAPVLHAQQPGPIPALGPDFTFGMVGLAPNQTARLNVVNIGVPGGSQFPCGLVLAFIDSDGQTLKQAFVRVDRGKAAFLDLSLSETQAQQRIQIRGIGYNPLLTPASAIPIAAGCNLIPTLEVFSTDTGNTSVILTEVVRLGTSIPPPPSSPGQ